MNSRRNRFSGETLDEYISVLPGDLPNDAIPLASVIPALAVSFDLSEDDLIKFSKHALFELFRQGGVPVNGAKSDASGNFDWAYVDCGESPSDWVENITRNWIPLREEKEYWTLWIASPKYMRIESLPQRFKIAPEESK